MARKISVEILGDSTSLEKAFARSAKSAQKFNAAGHRHRGITSTCTRRRRRCRGSPRRKRSVQGPVAAGVQPRPVPARRCRARCRPRLVRRHPGRAGARRPAGGDRGGGVHHQRPAEEHGLRVDDRQPRRRLRSVRAAPGKHWTTSASRSRRCGNAEECVEDGRGRAAAASSRSSRAAPRRSATRPARRQPEQQEADRAAAMDARAASSDARRTARILVRRTLATYNAAPRRRADALANSVGRLGQYMVTQSSGAVVTVQGRRRRLCNRAGRGEAVTAVNRGRGRRADHLAADRRPTAAPPGSRGSSSGEELQPDALAAAAEAATAAADRNADGLARVRDRTRRSDQDRQRRRESVAGSWRVPAGTDPAGGPHPRARPRSVAGPGADPRPEQDRPPPATRWPG